MTSPYIGEIRIFAGPFAPLGWMDCNGQLLPIAEYDSLFALIGTTYGGDGQQNFALPNLQSRVPIHNGTAQGGSNYALGQVGGVEKVTLTPQQWASHTHPLLATASNQTLSPANAVPAIATSQQANINVYGPAATPTTMSPGSVGTFVGGNQPHPNLQPYLTLRFIIALDGIYPTQ